MVDMLHMPRSHHDDCPHEECGVFGIFGHDDAAELTVLGLHALQHRGQEAAGIVTCTGHNFRIHRALGLVGDHFNNIDVISKLTGNTAIGHVRYSTTGDTLLRNVQPLFADFEFGGLAVAHNGNLTNSRLTRRKLIKKGAIFQSTMDTEIIVHLLAQSLYSTVVDRLIDCLRQLEGAYSLAVLTQKKLIGVRDLLGVRPLVLGKLGNAHIIASESCALDIIGAEFVRDVEPGEIVIIDDCGIKSLKPFGVFRKRFCVFEYIYFARPDSVVEGRNVYGVRKRIGAELARESYVEADTVVPVPDSGVPAALGYAEEAGTSFDLGIIRNHYVGRTFIEPTDRIRHLGVKLKHNANAAHIRGKRIVLVDDSIVRGTTSIKIVEMLQTAGAKEVHLRISSPPTTHPCFYGIDTPSQEELMAANHTPEEMAKLIGVTSLAYISQNGLYRAICATQHNTKASQYCDACFTGEYPTNLTDDYGSDLPEQLTLLSEENAK